MLACKAEDLSPPPKTSLRITKVTAIDRNLSDTETSEHGVGLWSPWILAMRQGRAVDDMDTREKLGQGIARRVVPTVTLYNGYEDHRV